MPVVTTGDVNTTVVCRTITDADVSCFFCVCACRGDVDIDLALYS